MCAYSSRSTECDTFGLFANGGGAVAFTGCQQSTFLIVVDIHHPTPDHRARRLLKRIPINFYQAILLLNTKHQLMRMPLYI